MDSDVRLLMKFRGMTEAQSRKSETSTTPTQINEFFSRLPEHYQETKSY